MARYWCFFHKRKLSKVHRGFFNWVCHTRQEWHFWATENHGNIVRHNLENRRCHLIQQLRYNLHKSPLKSGSEFNCSGANMANQRGPKSLDPTDPSRLFTMGFCKVCHECSWLHEHTMMILRSFYGGWWVATKLHPFPNLGTFIANCAIAQASSYSKAFWEIEEILRVCQATPS